MTSLMMQHNPGGACTGCRAHREGQAGWPIQGVDRGMLNPNYMYHPLQPEGQMKYVDLKVFEYFKPRFIINSGGGGGGGV